MTIAEAARRIGAGRLVAMPTETVYGLAADARNDLAIAEIFRIKGRPRNNPLIVHVAGVEQAKQYAAAWDERCDVLAALFWPGPLTLVLPKQAGVSAILTAGFRTVAVRCPAHPIARDLLASCGCALVAPSANRSGEVSPTTAAHVENAFASEDIWVLDGGACACGIESTVLDMSCPVPTLLRPGAVTLEQLREHLGEVQVPTITTQAASPGTAERHYAPSAPLYVLPPDEIDTIPGEVVVLALSDRPSNPRQTIIKMPSTPERYAQVLYASLHQADSLSPIAIIAEQPSSTEGLWKAIENRLHRAKKKGP